MTEGASGLAGAGHVAAGPTTAAGPAAPGMLPYALVDVFVPAGAPASSGNPLAVVLDADHLSPDARQALAAWFGLSETAFPVRPTSPGADYRLLIHTPEAEIPFAGHPSVGSAWLLGAVGRLAAGRTERPLPLVQQCGVGEVAVVLTVDGAELTGARPEVGPPLDAAALLAAVGLDAADLAPQRPRRASTGLPAQVLAVREGALARAVPRLDLLRKVGDNLAVVEVAEAGGSPATELRVRARVFAADLGVPEDPATGSAALALGAWLVAERFAVGDGTSRYTISQGVEMGRPCLLHGTVEALAGVATACRVAGGVRVVAHGTLDPRAIIDDVGDTG